MKTTVSIFWRDLSMRNYMRLFGICINMLSSFWGLADSTSHQKRCETIGGEIKDGFCYCKKNKPSIRWHHEGKLRYPFIQGCKRVSRKSTKEKLFSKFNSGSYKSFVSKGKWAIDKVEMTSASEDVLKKARLVLSHIKEESSYYSFLSKLTNIISDKISEERRHLILDYILSKKNKYGEPQVDLSLQRYSYPIVSLLSDKQLELVNTLSALKGKKFVWFTVIIAQNWDLEDEEKAILAAKIAAVARADEDAVKLLNAGVDKNSYKVFDEDDLKIYDLLLDKRRVLSDPVRLVRCIHEMRKEGVKDEFFERYNKLGFKFSSSADLTTALRIFSQYSFTGEDQYFAQTLQRIQSKPSSSSFATLYSISKYFKLYPLIGNNSKLTKEQSSILKRILEDALASVVNHEDMLKGLEFFTELKPEFFTKNLLYFYEKLQKIEGGFEGVFPLIKDMAKGFERLQGDYDTIGKALFEKAKNLGEMLSIVDSFQNLNIAPPSKERLELLNQKAELLGNLASKVVAHIIENVPNQLLKGPFLLDYNKASKILNQDFQSYFNSYNSFIKNPSSESEKRKRPGPIDSVSL